LCLGVLYVAIGRLVMRKTKDGQAAVERHYHKVFSHVSDAIGNVSVPALKTALPRSEDFTFINDGRDKWGLGFLITVDQVPGKRSPGSLSWGGINNTYFWIDPSRGIAGVIMMQYLPFADAKALAVYDAFERAVYQSHR